MALRHAGWLELDLPNLWVWKFDVNTLEIDIH